MMINQPKAHTPFLGTQTERRGPMPDHNPIPEADLREMREILGDWHAAGMVDPYLSRLLDEIDRLREGLQHDARV